MSKNTFQSVQANRPGMSVFDLSYMKTFTLDMGYLYPVMCDEMVPGDIFKIGNQSVIRFQPLVAPILHEVNVYVHYFFVPYRLLWSDWEDFITGGVNGNDATALPKWNPAAQHVAEGTLWDYLGFPTGVVPTATSNPSNFPKAAYNLIWDEYYRDETLQASASGQNVIRRRNWEKDYFTSSLPWQQRGTAPALPISGTTSAVWGAVQASGTYNVTPAGVFQTNAPPNYRPKDADTKGLLEANTIDLSTATTFNVADLRLAFQIQNGWNAMLGRA